MATAHGYRMRRARYGPETERLMAEARDRESWSPERLRAWQEERCAALLERAARHVPFYREQWSARRRAGDRSSVTLLDRWPVLEKETLRTRSRDFLADGVDPRQLQAEQTSGTTGTPVGLWKTTAMLRRLYAVAEVREREWHGVGRRDPWAMLGGRMVVPVTFSTPPFWVWNGALRQLYMSSYHLSPDNVPAYLRALRQYGVRWLWGYSSALFAIAEEVLRSGADAPRMEVAVTNAEPLFDYQRETIGRAFHCPVRATYGMSENVFAATECPHGRLHIWPEAGIGEVLDGAHAAVPGTTGDLVCTGLLNEEMPLIRYRVGDRVAIADGNVPCPCGRTLPVLAAVEGRADDVLLTADGRRVGRLDPAFKADVAIREAQVEQIDLQTVVLRLVPAPGYTRQTAETITRRLRERLGDVEVRVEECASIPRTANGKFRAVISRVALPAAPSTGGRT
jgi:phenylacetate-CoA ligase